MYSYEWDKKTRGYRLTTQTGKFVASEIRPVFAEELLLLGFDKHFDFDHTEELPFMWAKNNVYFYDGVEVAKTKIQLYKAPLVEYLVPRSTLRPVDIDGMLLKNKKIMDSLVANTQKRIKEMYEEARKKNDIIYIAFSGGKDSVLLLDLCNRVLPMTVPVIFSDTTMELPGTYEMWERIQGLYPERKFLKFSSEKKAIENWITFGPPSRTLDWCCSVHKSTPAVLALKEYLHMSSVRACAFLGIRSDESLKRDAYESDFAQGAKNASQDNAMPIESWGAHELYLYYFSNHLPLHHGYRKGLPRIGCAMCPKASDKYAWYVDKAYPHLLDPYLKVILNTSLKSFHSQKEENEYIANSGWQARRNGLEVKGRILAPSEKIKNDTIQWKNVFAPVSALREWVKTFSTPVECSADRWNLSSVIHDQHNCGYNIHLDVKDDVVVNVDCELTYVSLSQKKKLQTQMRNVIKKAIACVGCRACEAECSFGALKFSSFGVSIDSSRCVHCLKCHNIDQGCWRYKSMMVPNSSDTPLKSIANYQNFGLREKWIQIYCEEKQDFLNTTMLGKPMIDSARIWFKQALLTSDSRSLEPSRLLKVAQEFGSDSQFLWDLIWIGLCNNSPLVKWMASNIAFGSYTPIDEINNLLGDLPASTKRGGLQALNNLFKNSPIGTGASPVVELTQKGTRVLGLKRVPKSIEPLAVLYSLYLMATVSDRTSFTLSEMMTADFGSPYISPLVAFGMDVEALKGQCLGIASVHPEYLSCAFTLGLEEVKVFPREKSLDDVIGLILGE